MVTPEKTLDLAIRSGVVLRKRLSHNTVPD